MCEALVLPALVLPLALVPPLALFLRRYRSRR
jgi:hypothetical protein